MALRDPPGSYPCTDCTRIFDYWEDLISHCRTEHDPNIDEVLANVDGGVTYAQKAHELCKLIARNYEAQAAAEEVSHQQGVVVAESGMAKCHLCELEWDRRGLPGHLQSHARADALGIDYDEYKRCFMRGSGGSVPWIPCPLCCELCDPTTDDYDTHLKAHQDAPILQRIRRLEMLQATTREIIFPTAQKISHEAGDAPDAAAQDISRQKKFRARDKKMKKTKGEYTQEENQENCKDINEIMEVFDKMGNDNSGKRSAQGDKKGGTQKGKGGRKRGAQGGAKAQSKAKSSAKPLEAEKFTNKDKKEMKPCSNEAEDPANLSASTSVNEAEEKEAAEKDEELKPIEDEEKEDHVFDIFMKALKEAYGRYLEASSASSVVESAKRLEKLEELASELSSFCAGSASEDSSVLILKIVKAGIDYVLTDPVRHRSFLTSAIVKFASVLPEASFSTVLDYLKDQSKKANNFEGPSIYNVFAKTLHKKVEEEDETTSPSGGEGLFEAGKGDGIGFPYHLTGRKGEEVAFEYFSSLFRDRKVTWVNQFRESGQPYDIILKASDGTEQYVEVKSTILTEKDWFHLSLNELNFAMKQGAAYTIARVSFSEGDKPKVSTFPNVEKLIKMRYLKLGLYPAKGR